MNRRAMITMVIAIFMGMVAAWLTYGLLQSPPP